MPLLLDLSIEKANDNGIVFSDIASTRQSGFHLEIGSLGFSPPPFPLLRADSLAPGHGGVSLMLL